MKKVLIVTYYWPPAGGPGVQRWLKFVKYLPEQGIEPIVYIPENPSYPIIDHGLENEIPKGIEIIKHPIFEPYNLASIFGGKGASNINSGIIPPKTKQTWKQKMVLWVRGNFFIPDARKFWIKPSVSFLTKVIKEKDIGTLVTTGPPHSLHLIGLRLKEQLDVNWITDFRDPWTSIGYHKKMKLSKRSIQKHNRLELNVLNRADSIIVTSSGTKKEFEQKTQKPIHVITNGFEPVEIPDITLDAEFSISHIGSLLSGRNPEILWQSLGELIKENKDFATHFKLKLAGVVSQNIIERLKKYGVWNNTKTLGYVSHQVAQTLQRQSQVLLLIEIDSEETEMIIPGKLFEYLQSGRPILSIGPKNADFKNIIEETQTGTFFNYHQKVALKSEIIRFFNLFLENKLQAYPIEIEKYTRENLTAQLSKILKN